MLLVCKSPPCYQEFSSRAAYSIFGLSKDCRMCSNLFSREQKHSIQSEDSCCWTGLRMQKADAGVGTAPTCGGDRGPGWPSWTEKAHCLDVSFKQAQSYKTHLWLEVEARDMSDDLILHFQNAFVSPSLFREHATILLLNVPLCVISIWLNVSRGTGPSLPQLYWAHP